MSQHKIGEKLTFEKFHWINEPTEWKVNDNILKVVTEEKTDFWEKTYYNFQFHTGHVFGINIKEDFSFEACIQAEFSHLYDQAGLMIIVNEKQWLKTGIEYNDGQPMISSVLTNGFSDWATGIFTGNPKKFWMRLTKKGPVICIKYSCDNENWILLRLCPFPEAENYFVGLMTCTPLRKGLEVHFSDVKIYKPAEDILHANK